MVYRAHKLNITSILQRLSSLVLLACGVFVLINSYSVLLILPVYSLVLSLVFIGSGKLVFAVVLSVLSYHMIAGVTRFIKWDWRQD